jgi:hypothetical protein
MFKASAQLEFDVDDASLRQTKRRIEDELSDLAVGRGGGSGGVTGMLSRDVQSAQGGSGLASNSIAAAQLEQLEEINDNIEKLATSGDGGGGGLGPVGTLGLASAASGGGGALGGILSGLARGAGTVARRGAPSVLFSDRFGVRGVGRDGQGIGGGAMGLANAAEQAGRDMGLPDLGNMQLDVAVPSWLRGLELSAPSWLQDPMLQVPEFLRDLSVSVPSFLNDLSVTVPSVLRDLPQISFDVPPWLRGLFGNESGGNGINPNRPRQGGDAALQNYVDSQTTNRTSGGLNLGPLRIEHDFRNATREVERAVEDAVSNSGALEREVERILSRKFENGNIG